MFANLSNYQTFYAAFTYLQESSQPEKLMAVHGLPGLGKTRSISELASRLPAVYYYCSPGHSPRSLCQDILHKCQQQPSGTSTSEHISSVANYLSEHRMPLFLDDCDNIASRGIIIETVRAIHDLSGQPVVMVGMANFVQKLSRHAQIIDRAHLLEFAPIVLDDVRKLTYGLSTLAFADDICTEILQVSQGKARLASRAIGYIDNWANAHNWEKVDLALWGDRELLPRLGVSYG
jgi:hypothetical protein